MKLTSLMLPLAGISLALALTACGTTTTADTSGPTPAAAESSTASSQTSATATPTGSASTTESAPQTLGATTSAPASTTSTPKEEHAPVPTPTVVEVSQGPAEETQAPAPAPTGTVITLGPNDEESQQPSASATSTVAHAPSSAAGVAVCDYGQIYIAAAVTEGAAGSKYINLTFTNTGNTDCAMNGYPSVHYVDAAGHQIGAPAARATEWSANGTVLSPGASTTATLRETRAQLYGETCQSAPAAGYSVQAPGASQPLVLNFAAEACSNAAVSQLSVGAVGATP